MELEDEDNEVEIEISQPKKLRVFVNCVDSYTSLNISQHLSTCEIGSTLEGFKENEEEVVRSEDQLSDSSAVLLGYEVSGTVSAGLSTDSPPRYIQRIIATDDIEQLEDEVFQFDVIIYDILESPSQLMEAQQMLKMFERRINDITDQKIFIVLSSVLTWTRTTRKQETEDNPDTTPFREDDYRRRKAHFNFRQEIAFEKEVIRVGKIRRKQFRTYVVVTGIQYGKGEKHLFPFFKLAWCNASEIPIVGDGKNIIPLIYIMDLALIVQNIIEKKPRPPRYILGVDGVSTPILEVIQAIGNSLSDAVIKPVTPTAAASLLNFKPEMIDLYTSNLYMESTVVSNTLQVKLIFQDGFVANIAKIAKEFLTTMNLQPVRLFILGPPWIYKKMFLSLLCNHYKIHYIGENMIDIIIKELTADTQLGLFPVKSKPFKDTGDDEDGEEEMGSEDEILDKLPDIQGDALEPVPLTEKQMQRREKAVTLLSQIRLGKEKGGIEPELILKLMKEKLQSKPFQNQGFVLDAYPQTIQQASNLFTSEFREEETEAETGESSNSLMPELVICFNAPNEFLVNQWNELPQNIASQIFDSKEQLQLKIDKFHEMNPEDGSVIEFFDENEIRIENIDLSLTSLKEVFERVKQLIGPPRNFDNRLGIGHSKPIIYEPPRETEDLRRHIENEFKQIQVKEREQQDMIALKTAEEEMTCLKYWSLKYKEIKHQKEELLKVETMPLRYYVMEYVMPTLSKILLDVTKVRPEDPIEYIAEHILKYIPEESQIVERKMN